MTSNGPATVIPSEVGWQFVPQYYAFINKEPERLHCFYSKQSIFVHGTEGEEAKTCNGQQEIHTQINSLGFQDCKIFIHSVDAQSSANGGIIIQVIGEMSNAGGPWRKFVQTFFLAEQPNGYFVLNDIFRFLKEDAVEGEEASDSAEPEATQAAAPAEPATTIPVAPAPVEPPREPTPPPPPPPPPVLEPAPVPVEEPPTTVSEIPEPEPAPVEPVSQLNGVHSEPEKLSAPAAPTAPPVVSEKPKSPAPPAAPPAAQTPPPQSTPTAQPPPPVQPPAAVAPPPSQPAPQQPAAAPAPKTWANLAAANSKKWGAAVAQESRGTTEVVPSSPASGSQTPQTPGTPGGASGARQGGRSPHPAYQAAQSVAIPQCFIKNVGENITEPALKQALQRFGGVKQAEIVRAKGCAFVEFTSVDAAKRAIIASLSPNAGGEGGVKVEVPGEGPVRIVVETKRDRADRPANARGRGGPPFSDGRGSGGTGGDRGSFRGRGGRGRGNTPK